MRKITLYIPEGELDGAALAKHLEDEGFGYFSFDGDEVRSIERPQKTARTFMEPRNEFAERIAAAEARHKRDGFDLQWCSPPELGVGLNWYPVRENGGSVIIEGLVLCSRPSGANAEARHAAEQKSRDRVAADLAQYQHADSIHDIRITRHISTKEEAEEL